MNHLSLFSGIGGIDLAAEWAGFNTVAFVEKDKFCQKVLAKHWPGVPIYDDVTTFTANDVRGPVTLLSGGFPCQDVSLAGEQAGLNGKRSTLWSEFARLICEIKPKWVLVENVLGLLSSDDGQFFGNILRDLASLGYDAEWNVLSASAIGAPHQRKRVFIIAYSSSIRGFSFNDGLGQEWKQERCLKAVKERWADASTVYLPSLGFTYVFMGNQPRVGNGISDRVDRLRALGNAVVPQQVYPILKAIAEWEQGIRD